MALLKQTAKNEIAIIGKKTTILEQKIPIGDKKIPIEEVIRCE